MIRNDTAKSCCISGKYQVFHVVLDSFVMVLDTLHCWNNYGKLWSVFEKVVWQTWN